VVGDCGLHFWLGNSANFITLGINENRELVSVCCHPPGWVASDESFTSPHFPADSGTGFPEVFNMEQAGARLADQG